MALENKLNNELENNFSQLQSNLNSKFPKGLVITHLGVGIAMSAFTIYGGAPDFYGPSFAIMGSIPIIMYRCLQSPKIYKLLNS